jgi:hypothetical protein
MTTDDAAADRSAVLEALARGTPQSRAAQAALDTAAAALGPGESSAQHDNLKAQFANIDSRIRQLAAEAVEFEVGIDELRAATTLSSTELAALLHPTPETATTEMAPEHTLCLAPRPRWRT